MNKYAYYRASMVLSGASVAFALTWAATGAPWAAWGMSGAFAAALGLAVGGYIEPEEQ